MFSKLYIPYNSLLVLHLMTISVFHITSRQVVGLVNDEEGMT